jgi:hypothetical protein
MARPRRCDHHGALALQGAALVTRRAWGELRPQRLIPAE